MKEIKSNVTNKLIKHFLKKHDETIRFNHHFWIVFRSDFVKNNKLAYKILTNNPLMVHEFLKNSGYVDDMSSRIFSIEIIPEKFIIVKFKSPC